ncbi:UNVERIFIED_CONTAM: ybaA [Trichonephila clavipes]
MAYIDGFVIPVRTEDREIYRDHEAKWWPYFRDEGALSLVVGWGDDVPPGKQTDFLRAVEAKEHETVVLCWMIWPDKETRGRAYEKMMKLAEEDPAEFANMPFDGKRMIFGGFTPLLMEGAAK